MYRESNGEIQLKDIAAALGVKEGTVRVWKNRNKWDEKIGVTLQKNKCNVTDKKCNVTDDKKHKKPTKTKAYNMTKESYPLKARYDNKNAISTGEFEKIMFDTMDETELQLIKTIEENKKDLLIKEIQLLTVRERRMLKGLRI